MTTFLSKLMDSNLAAADRLLVEIVDSLSLMKRIPRCPAVCDSISASGAVLPAQTGQSIARNLIFHSHFTQFLGIFIFRCCGSRSCPNRTRFFTSTLLCKLSIISFRCALRLVTLGTTGPHLQARFLIYRFSHSTLFLVPFAEIHIVCSRLCDRKSPRPQNQLDLS
jgi:hypothetical protein